MSGLSNLKSILIADDHNLFRQGLRLVLEGMVPGVRIVEAADLEGALEVVSGDTPLDLVMLDLSMPGMETEGNLALACETAGPTPVVILSAFNDQAGIHMAMNAGASGYILKSFSDESLRHVLELILSGEVYVPPAPYQAADRFPEAIHAPTRPTRGITGAATAPGPLQSLTARQLEVLTLIMQGQSNKEIGRTLGVYESTVKTHIQVILQKLNADNRTHAAMIAREWSESEGTSV